MWCFFDESWSVRPDGQRVGVLFALTMPYRSLRRLDATLYAIRKKYYDARYKDGHAKDYERELKGKELLSAWTFRLLAKNKGEPPVNHCVAREILSWLGAERARLKLDAFAMVVYGADPRLACVEPRKLELPYRELLHRISVCSRQRGPRSVTTLVFDSREVVQKPNAIALRNFIAGTQIDNINPCPYFAVSNVEPAIQVADICAYIVGKRAAGNRWFITPWYEALKRFQWSGLVNGVRWYGFRRYDQTGPQEFRIRQSW